MWCLTENDEAILRRAEKIHSEGDVQCKIGGQEEYRIAD